jgi:hypothetical protein
MKTDNTARMWAIGFVLFTLIALFIKIIFL